MPQTSEVEPRKLLIVVNVAWFFISHRLPLAVAARKAGFDVHVAAGSATEREQALINNEDITFHDLRLARSSRDPFSNLRLLAHLIDLYRALRPDVVHHVTIKPVMLGSLAARLTRVPMVVNAVSGLGYSFSATNAMRRGLRKLVGFAYRLCLSHRNMILIFQNIDDERDFYHWTHIKPKRSVRIAGSGVDLSAFRVTNEPLTGAIVACLPARMLRDKGIMEFSRAIHMLQHKGLAIRGILAGTTDPDNPESLSEQDLRSLERDYGVIWVGHVSDMPTFLANSNIVCLPSYREGLPKALIEASAAARAIVTTDVPGCRHVVENEITGLLVPVRDSARLADALERLALDAGLRKRFASAARARAEREFDVRLIVSETLTLYN